MSKKKISVIFFAFILLLSFSGSAIARRFGSSRGGFSRSFGRRSSGFFSSGRRRSRPRGGAFSSRRGSKSRADSMLSRKTAQKGKMFSSRKAAVSDYKKNLKNRWSSKPKRRPKYIPNSVSSGGRNYNVVFNNGRYGFWNSAGSFMALTAANMLITDAMLSRRGYGYGGGYGGGYGAGYGGAYPPSSGISFTGLIFFGLIIYFAMRIRRG